MTHAFCTLFDINFAPQGLCMIDSLRKFMPSSRVFVLAMDDEAYQIVRRRYRESLEVITLTEIETKFPDLIRVKTDRTRGEYCWTLTPFLPRLVLDKGSDLLSATYVDADLYFMRSPQEIIDELYANKKTVLITEHGYDPKYDQSSTSGLFCVQFVVFCQDPNSIKVLDWWMERCLEWCYDRHEDGKFGDQKYLDVWPDLFSDCVHIYSKPWENLAPWNVEHWYKMGKIDRDEKPIFYHFHGLRVFKDRIRAFTNYKIKSRSALGIYDLYVKTLIANIAYLREARAVQFLPTWSISNSTSIFLRLKDMIRYGIYQMQSRIRHYKLSI